MSVNFVHLHLVRESYRFCKFKCGWKESIQAYYSPMISGLLWTAPGDTFSCEHLVLLARATTWTRQLCFPESVNICPNCGTKPACPKLTSLLIYKHTNRGWWKIIPVRHKGLRATLPISSALARMSGATWSAFQRAALTNTTLPLWMQHGHNKPARKEQPLSLLFRDDSRM